MSLLCPEIPPQREEYEANRPPPQFLIIPTDQGLPVRVSQEANLWTHVRATKRVNLAREDSKEEDGDATKRTFWTGVQIIHLLMAEELFRANNLCRVSNLCELSG